jgi:hypothetical protein
VIDGEVVVLRPDGVSDFDALASRKLDKRSHVGGNQAAEDVDACGIPNRREHPLGGIPQLIINRPHQHSRKRGILERE